MQASQREEVLKILSANPPQTRLPFHSRFLAWGEGNYGQWVEVVDLEVLLSSRLLILPCRSCLAALCAFWLNVNSVLPPLPFFFPGCNFQLKKCFLNTVLLPVRYLFWLNFSGCLVCFIFSTFQFFTPLFWST